MAQWYLSDLTTTFSIDDNIQEIEFGGLKREYGIERFTGSNGGIISGSGVFGERKFSIMRKEIKSASESMAWNTRRQEYLNWFLKSRYKKIYLYCVNANSITMRTEVVCTDIGSEKYKSLRISGERDITLISPSGYFEGTSLVSQAGVTGGSGYSSFNITATASMIDIPFIWTITPQADTTQIKIWIAESIGFALSGSFKQDVTIIYNHIDNTLKIGDNFYNINNYLVAGDAFEIANDVTTIYYYTDASCDISAAYYRRYI